MRVILIAGAFALLISLFGTPLLIRILAKRGFGQVIRDDGPTSHHTKRGTPTMGGIVIIFAAVLAYSIAHVFSGRPPTISALLVIGLVIALGLIGFIDDYLKISRKQSLGLTGKQKLLAQALIASLFGYLGIQFADLD